MHQMNGEQWGVRFFFFCYLCFETWFCGYSDGNNSGQTKYTFLIILKFSKWFKLLVKGLHLLISKMKATGILCLQ
jgi:hypothetical protein